MSDCMYFDKGQCWNKNQPTNQDEDGACKSGGHIEDNCDGYENEEEE